MTWLYRSITQAKPGSQKGDFTVYEVGYLDFEHRDRTFRTVETYGDKDDARDAVHYLNGGSPRS